MDLVAKCEATHLASSECEQNKISIEEDDVSKYGCFDSHNYKSH